MTVMVPLNEITGISRISAHEGDQVVSPMHWPHLPPRRYSWYSFLLQAELTQIIPGSQTELCSMLLTLP